MSKRNDAVEEEVDYARRVKAKQMRFKDPLVRGLNLEAIRQGLYDMDNACEDALYGLQTNQMDTLCDDDLMELQTALPMLSGDCEKMLEELDSDEVDIPEFFDLLFVATVDADDWGGLDGYDSYEGDYYSLSDHYEQEAAVEVARQKLMRLTKDELIRTVRQCCRIFAAYVGIKYRYDCLSTSIDILRGQHNGLTGVIKEIEKLYDQAEAATRGFKLDYGKEIQALNIALARVPDEMWVQ